MAFALGDRITTSDPVRFSFEVDDSALITLIRRLDLAALAFIAFVTDDQSKFVRVNCMSLGFMIC